MEVLVCICSMNVEYPFVLISVELNPYAWPMGRAKLTCTRVMKKPRKVKKRRGEIKPEWKRKRVNN